MDQTQYTPGLAEFQQTQREWYEHFRELLDYPHDVADVLSWALTYKKFTLEEDGMASTESLIRMVLDDSEVGQSVEKVMSGFSEFDGFFVSQKDRF